MGAIPDGDPLALRELIWRQHPGYAEHPTVSREEIQARVDEIARAREADADRGAVVGPLRRDSRTEIDHGGTEDTEEVHTGERPPCRDEMLNGWGDPCGRDQFPSSQRIVPAGG